VDSFLRVDLGWVEFRYKSLLPFLFELKHEEWIVFERMWDRFFEERQRIKVVLHACIVVLYGENFFSSGYSLLDKRTRAGRMGASGRDSTSFFRFSINFSKTQ
jgi:hypothetical protein